MKPKEAHKFLKDLARATGVKYDKELANQLVRDCDLDGDGIITLKEFQYLFFSSSEKLNLSMFGGGCICYFNLSSRVSGVWDLLGYGIMTSNEISIPLQKKLKFGAGHVIGHL
jgi:hypothetical protein